MEKKYPIILGHKKNGKSDKCLLAGMEDGHLKVLICRFRDGMEKQAGDKDFGLDEVGQVIAEIWFCRKETLENFIGILQQYLDIWDDIPSWNGEQIGEESEE